MSDIINFTYDGQAISFEFSDGNKMIHANQMAKPFGKRVDNFLRLQGTKEFILLLEARYSDVREREILRVMQGGTPELQGTWMDEKLALKFAAWLSPEFELWVYDRIQELLTTGSTSLQGIQPAGFAKPYDCWQNNGKSKNRSMRQSEMNWIRRQRGSTNLNPKSSVQMKIIIP